MRVFHGIVTVTVWLTAVSTLLAGLPRFTCGCSQSSSKAQSSGVPSQQAGCGCCGACCSGKSAAVLGQNAKYSCCTQAKSGPVTTAHGASQFKRQTCAGVMALAQTIALSQMQSLKLANTASMLAVPLPGLLPHVAPVPPSSTLQSFSGRQAAGDLLTLLMHLVI